MGSIFVFLTLSIVASESKFQRTGVIAALYAVALMLWLCKVPVYWCHRVTVCCRFCVYVLRTSSVLVSSCHCMLSLLCLRFANFQCTGVIVALYAVCIFLESSSSKSLWR